MTAKEYLNQARHLDALINCRLREIDYWRDLSSSVSGSNFEPHYNPNKPTGWYSVTVTWTTAPGRRYPGC